MAPLSSHWKLFPYIPFTSTQGRRADSYQSPPQPHPQPTMEREKQKASDKERATRAKDPACLSSCSGVSGPSSSCVWNPRVFADAKKLMLLNCGVGEDS